MRKKISVIGGQGVRIGGDLARYADVTDELCGADVVVLAGEADLEAVRERAPAAVVILAGDRLEDRCAQAYAATLFPRTRIFGSDDAPAAAAAVVFERGDEHEVVAMADGRFERRTVRLGRGGIRELL